MANAVELLDRQTSQSLNDSMATYYTTKQNIVFVAQELVENLAYLANTDVQTRKTNIIRNSLFRNRSKINTTVPPVAPQPASESPKAAEIKSSTEDLMNLFNDAPATAAGTVVEPVHTPAPPPQVAEPSFAPPPPVMEAKPPEPAYTPPPPIVEPAFAPPPPAHSAIGGFDELDSFFAEPAATTPAAVPPVTPPPVVEAPVVAEVVPPPAAVKPIPPLPPIEPASSTADLLGLFDEFAAAPPAQAEPAFTPPPPVVEPVYTPPVVEMRPPEPIQASQVSYETTPAQDLDDLKNKLSTTNSSVMISPSIKNNFSAILMEIESNLSNMKSYNTNKEALISLYDKLKHNQNMSMQEIVDLSRQIVEANKFVEEYQTKAKDELDSMENVAELFKEMADALVYNIRKAKNDFNRDS